MDRRRRALEPLPGVLGHRRHRPLEHLGVGRLDAANVLVVEAAGQLAGRGRRRRLGHGAQLGAGSVGAQPLEIGHEVAAGQHHLHKRHHQPAAAQAPAALLDRPDVAIQRVGHPQCRVDLGDQQQPRRRRQRGSLRRMSTPRFWPATLFTIRLPFAVGVFGSFDTPDSPAAKGLRYGTAPTARRTTRDLGLTTQDQLPGTLYLL